MWEWWWFLFKWRKEQEATLLYYCDGLYSISNHLKPCSQWASNRSTIHLNVDATFQVSKGESTLKLGVNMPLSMADPGDTRDVRHSQSIFFSFSCSFRKKIMPNNRLTHAPPPRSWRPPCGYARCQSIGGSKGALGTRALPGPISNRFFSPKSGIGVPWEIWVGQLPKAKKTVKIIQEK